MHEIIQDQQYLISIMIWCTGFLYMSGFLVTTILLEEYNEKVFTNPSNKFNTSIKLVISLLWPLLGVFVFAIMIKQILERIVKIGNH